MAKRRVEETFENTSSRRPSLQWLENVAPSAKTFSGLSGLLSGKEICNHLYFHFNSSSTLYILPSALSAAYST